MPPVARKELWEKLLEMSDEEIDAEIVRLDRKLKLDLNTAKTVDPLTSRKGRRWQSSSSLILIEKGPAGFAVGAVQLGSGWVTRIDVPLLAYQLR